MTNQNNRIEFRSAELKQAIATRTDGSIGAIAERDLSRYYLLLAHELKRIKLSSNEAMFFCDLLNGTLSDFHINPANMLLIEAQDGIDMDKLDQKWELDKEPFLAKISGFNILQAAAIIDGVERFWVRSHEEDSQAIVADIFGAK
jgi:hypothetical protein